METKIRDTYFYCYNLKQAEFIKRNGIQEEEFNISNINNKAYFKFKRGNQLDKIFKLWIKNKEV
jgi:hypothetical protein